MELDQLTTSDEHESGAKCQLIAKDGKVADAFVIVQGPDSKAFRQAKRKQRQAIIKLQEKGTNFDEYDFFELDVTFVCAVVSDWGDITKGGKAVEFGAEPLRSLLEKSPINVERILDFCGERENFIKG